MNQAELALFQELAPKLNEYRGELQVGDRFYNQETNSICCFSERSPHGLKHYSHILWLPSAIDPQDPERLARGEKPRSLWYMVDWKRFNFELEDNEGTMRIWKAGVGQYGKPIATRQPTEALLLALKAQWKEER